MLVISIIVWHLGVLWFLGMIFDWWPGPTGQYIGFRSMKQRIDLFINGIEVCSNLDKTKKELKGIRKEVAAIQSGIKGLLQ